MARRGLGGDWNSDEATFALAQLRRFSGSTAVPLHLEKEVAGMEPQRRDAAILAAIRPQVEQSLKK